MKSAYLIGGILALVCFAIAIYYILPGFYHVLTFSDPYKSHVTHFILFIGLGVISLIGARFAANSRPR